MIMDRERILAEVRANVERLADLDQPEREPEMTLERAIAISRDGGAGPDWRHRFRFDGSLEPKREPPRIAADEVAAMIDYRDRRRAQQCRELRPAGRGNALDLPARAVN